MALITCPDCERKISDQAAACPQCGYPVAEKFARDRLDQEAGDAIGEEVTDSLGDESLEPEQETTGRSTLALLVFGFILVVTAAFATDYGGVKTRFLELTGNAPPTIDSEAAVRKLFVSGSELFDPHSAKFRNLMYTDADILKDTVWCGEVNAKNRMGAYVGWHRFSASQTDEGEVEVSIFSGISEEVADMLYDMRCKGTYPAPSHVLLEKK